MDCSRASQPSLTSWRVLQSRFGWTRTVSMARARVAGSIVGLASRFQRVSMVLEGDIPNCSGKLHDPVKPAFRRLGILSQQLRTSPLFARSVENRLIRDSYPSDR